MAVDADPRSLTHHVSQALAGDAESFGELVRRYQGGVQGLAYHLTGNFADAQDVVQETFVTAYTRLDQLRDPERFGSWLRTIAHNECGARWRGRRDGLPLDDLPPSAEPADTAGTVDVEMERRETWAHVRRVLARLPESSRLTLTLHYLSDWSYADIAEFLDVPITTVVGRMHRARLLLQERLEPMVRETFQTERLGDARIAAIVAGAIDKAKEANERWERATFLAHTDEALAALDPTSTDPEVARGRVEILGMRGDARATDRGRPESRRGLPARHSHGGRGWRRRGRRPSVQRVGRGVPSERAVRAGTQRRGERAGTVRRARRLRTRGADGRCGGPVR